MSCCLLVLLLWQQARDCRSPPGVLSPYSCITQLHWLCRAGTSHAVVHAANALMAPTISALVLRCAGLRRAERRGHVRVCGGAEHPTHHPKERRWVRLRGRL